MKVSINVKLVNSEFNQSIADDFYQGKESEDNIKYLWEDEFEVKGDVRSFKIHNNTVFKLQGYDAGGKPFSYDIPNMTIAECILDDEQVIQFAFSKKLILKTDKIDNRQEDAVLFAVQLKNTLELVNPVDGIYILEEDFPKELQN